MCNNNNNVGYISRDVVACQDAIDALEKFWRVNAFSGVASIWTPDGPFFFDMAQTTPKQALLELSNECGDDWTTVADWVKTISVGELH